ncbi:hypothetical protein HNO52_06635 [Billgrantia diversa]|uniref:hypothetical protein n=1 Tax=Halomonas sp. MCCC 1A13316 TaxID=2733487 RepID=UPI0018A36CD8|nr:hypothetical protein [Halomonas sp. MCCC 1A13316]QOR38223.1 hypothetical protein HNO52_06635 [Halomonas sp. MCCC 1A13316]
MDDDLTDHQIEILSFAMQHGGVLAAPFGHLGEDSKVAEMEEHVARLAADGLVSVRRDEEGELERIEVTSKGYAALGVR